MEPVSIQSQHTINRGQQINVAKSQLIFPTRHQNSLTFTASLNKQDAITAVLQHFLWVNFQMFKLDLQKNAAGGTKRYQ